jgi:hypothetical protein
LSDDGSDEITLPISGRSNDKMASRRQWQTTSAAHLVTSSTPFVSGQPAKHGRGKDRNPAHAKTGRKNTRSKIGGWRGSAAQSFSQLPKSRAPLVQALGLKPQVFELRAGANPIDGAPSQVSHFDARGALNSADPLCNLERDRVRRPAQGRGHDLRRRDHDSACRGVQIILLIGSAGQNAPEVFGVREPVVAMGAVACSSCLPRQ